VSWVQLLREQRYSVGGMPFRYYSNGPTDSWEAGDTHTHQLQITRCIVTDGMTEWKGKTKIMGGIASTSYYFLHSVARGVLGEWVGAMLQPPQGHCVLFTLSHFHNSVCLCVSITTVRLSTTSVICSTLQSDGLTAVCIFSCCRIIKLMVKGFHILF
jgi:hypothetical protein